MSELINSITLLGSSSGRNAGDAALLSGIMDSIDETCGRKLRYEIPTIKPSYLKANYKNNVVPISMFPWNGAIKILGLPTYNSVMRTDLSLIFDAVLFDRALYNPLFNFMSTFSLILPRAKKRGKKLGLFDCGLGPVTTPAGRSMLRDLLEVMDFITLRDRGALEILQDIGVKNKNVILAADAALLVSPSSQNRIDEILTNEGLSGCDEFLGININRYLDSWAGTGRTPLTREQFLSIYSKALNILADKIKAPLVFVVTQHHDLDITQELAQMVSWKEKKVIIANTKYNHYEIKGVLGRLSLLFGMRLHAMIMATGELTPTVGLAYQPKCDYYFEMLAMQEYIMKFANFEPQFIAEHVLRGWQERKAMQEKLTQVIPVLKGEAKKAAQLVKAISSGEDIASLIVGNTPSKVGNIG